jgi:hypothetical protein
MNKVLLKYNNITHLPADYQHRVMNLGDFYQQTPFDSDFQVYYVTELDFALASLDPSTDWVVVVSAGHCSHDRNIYDKLIVEALKSNSPMIGHVLNFKDQYPHIHPQLFAFNYKTWVSAGWPSWEYSGEAEHFIANAIESSVETFHDDYTPYWIRNKGHLQEYAVEEMQVGAQVIREFVEMGLTITNVPEHIRRNKFHLYPDQQWENFYNFLQGKNYTGSVHEQKQYSELITNLQKQVKSQYYVLNTEPLQRPEVNEKIDHYSGVAAGLKLFATAVKNGFDENTSITYFDFSQTAINFQKYVIENWDGNISTYENVCTNFTKNETDSFVCQPRGTYQENLDYLIEQIDCSAEILQVHWKQFKKLSIEFIELNLYNKQDQKNLAKLIQKHNNNYLWISNAFWMEYSLVMFGKDQLKEFRDNLFMELQRTNSKVYLDVEDTWYQGIITFAN